MTTRTSKYPYFPTPEELESRFYENVENAHENLLILCKCVSGQRPTKPTLPSNHTLEDINNYASAFKTYESEMIFYREKGSLVRDEKVETERIMTNYVKLLSQLDTIPEKSREKTFQWVMQRKREEGWG